MTRLAYEAVAAGVDYLTNQMIAAKTIEERFYYSEQCAQYLASCGWTADEFENETLRRIDAAWDEDESIKN